MSYEQYPGGPAGMAPAAPAVPKRAVPESVQRAFYVMLAGAVLTVLSVIVSLVQLPQAIDRAEQTSSGNAALDPSTLDAIAYTSAGAGIVGSLIQIGLWVWLAYSCRAGKNWARITSTVFFGIDTFLVIAGVALLAGGSAMSSKFSTNVQTSQLVVSTSISVLIWLAGLGAIVLLWRKDSSAFFTAPVGYPYGYPPAGMPYGVSGAYGAYGNPGPGQYGSPVPGQYGSPATGQSVEGEPPQKNSWSTGEQVPPE